MSQDTLSLISGFAKHDLGRRVFVRVTTISSVHRSMLLGNDAVGRPLNKIISEAKGHGERCSLGTYLDIFP